MTDDLFLPNNEIVIDPNKNYLPDYVGEGKKFKTPEDLAKSKYHADTYISLLEKRLDQKEAERQELKKEFETRARLEELITQLTNKNPTTTTIPNTPESKVESQVIAPALDSTKIDELVSTKISQWDTHKRQTANVAEVRGKLTERFGSNFSEVLKAKADELGVSPTFLNSLAKDHPSVLYKTLGLDQQVQPVNMHAPTTTQRFAPQGEKKRTWSYYQEMKKTDPDTYNNPRTALQMQRDAIEQGDAFQDGDYHRDFSKPFSLT
ncbi:MAG TPA: hypothetical protein VGJ00_04045 [Rhabdochlamydiaceae bacterium]|jgi:hypothetical protein